MEEKKYPIKVDLNMDSISNEAIFKEAIKAKKFIEQQLAYGTKRVYQSDWRIFENWCNKRNFQATNATPEIIGMFIASQFEDGRHPSTLNRRLAAIKFAYSYLEKESPTDSVVARAVLKGIKRDENAPPIKAKKAAINTHIKGMVQLCPSNSLRDIRDRAILLLLFAGAFRRSELVAINIEDIIWSEKGMEIKILRSKTDQESAGDVTVILPAENEVFCPIKAVKDWIDTAQLKDGALFRGITKNNKILQNRLNYNVVYFLFKLCAFKLGLPLKEFSPHSSRAGFVTSAYENGAMITKIMEQARMKSMQTVHRYIRHAQKYENHPGKGLL